MSIGSATRSEVKITSARRPGVIEPSSRSRPKCWAVLSVAIWIAVIGFRPQEMAWRTTRFMWPSFTSVPRVAVVRTQNEIARIEPALGDGLDLRRHVVPGGAEPQHGAHALAHPGDGILDAGSLVVVGGAARHIGMERRPEIGRGIVAADGLAGALRGGDLAQHVAVVGGDARKSSSSRQGR